jgi:carbonic anhydrase
MLSIRSLPTFIASIAGAALLFACTTSAPHEDHVRHWGYGADTGPAHWCELDPTSSPCCLGSEQSPIDITSSTAVERQAAKLELFYTPATFSVANNGHTVQATLKVGAARCGLSLNGVVYDLQQFHVHVPSEHAIDGKHWPLELHFVHKSASGSLAVVGVLVEPDASGADRDAAGIELQKVWRIAPEHEGPAPADSERIAVGVDLSKVMPAVHANYRYEGSLTTPPCSEHVQWIVMQSPITMSKADIDKLQSMFAGTSFPAGNARPVQPIGARTVELDAGG